MLPRASANNPDGETIGIFGVGSKRAVVALAETTIIKRGNEEAKAFKSTSPKSGWNQPTGRFPHFQIPDIEEGMTILEMSSLRKSFAEANIESLRQHIGETCEWFLQIDNCVIKVNEVDTPKCPFDALAYPPSNERGMLHFRSN